ncbi:MAG TPA: hypothetical protein VFG43_11520 [Geminicoccaceae bacterium]|nr:hypothetical protein [Geminicoccaceae bacterium]
MNSWHPASKLVLGVAVVALPYLVWTALSEAPAAVRPALVPSAEIEPSAQTALLVAAEPARRVAVPPLGHFATILERPLFAPSRRPPEGVIVAAVAEPEPVEPVFQPVPPPQFRLVGTVAKGADRTALIYHPQASELVRLGPGDSVDDWRVLEIRTNSVVLEQGHDGLQLVLTMLE